jgi:hypothetical protein
VLITARAVGETFGAARSAQSPADAARTVDRRGWADSAELSPLRAVGGIPQVRGDAVVAACSAEAASWGAVHPVRVVPGKLFDHERLGRVAALAEAAARAGDRAFVG